MSLAVLADNLASKGRGGDSMLVHMAPEEVRALQALAERHGTSLTINPETGQPEALSLKKLLPAAIGFGLNFIAPGVGSAIGSALGTSAAVGTGIAVGGITALATGSIERGLMAGIGAYGGAGLAGGLAEAGASALGSEAFAAEAAKGAAPEALEAAVKNRIAEATMGEKLSAGLSAATSSPTAALGFTKSNFAPLYAAASPVMADAMVPTTTKLPEGSDDTGNIRKFSFDPYGQTYTPLGVYPAKGYKGMAGGGIVALAGGGVSDTDIQNWFKANPGATDAQIAAAMKQYGVSTGQLSQAMGFNLDEVQQRYDAATAAQAAPVQAAPVQASPVQAAPTQTAPATSAFRAINQNEGHIPYVQAFLQENPYATAEDVQRVVQSFGGTFDPIGKNVSTSTGSFSLDQWRPSSSQLAGGISDLEVKNWFETNPGATDEKIAAAMWQFGVPPEQVARVTGIGVPEVEQRFERAITPTLIGGYSEGVAGPNATTAKAGSGTLGIYENLVKAGIDATELFGYMGGNSPEYAGMSKEDIARAYDVARLVREFDSTTGAKPTSDREWLAFMNRYRLTPLDIARATGLSLQEVERRYKAAMNPFGSGDKTGTTPDGREVDIGTPGDVTYTPSGDVTRTPNLPGRPYGGYTGIDDVTDAYTAGGGSFGYTPYAPKTLEEFYGRYKNTGGSKQAYDYLMGRGAYPLRPVTPTGEVMRPYTEAVLGIPAAAGRPTQRFIFDPETRTYKENPDYRPLAFDSTGKRSVAPSTNDIRATIAKGDEAVQALVNSDAVSYETLAALLGITVEEAKKRFPKKDKESEKSDSNSEPIIAPYGNPSDYGGAAGGGQVKNNKIKRMALGGLGALAAGGQAGYNLGGYSDGGRLLKGPGDGVSDSIPATIGDRQPARLADGEFVVPARIVSELGNGSTEAGARKLYAMMDRVQKARGKTTGKGKVAKNTNADKYLPA